MDRKQTKLAKLRERAVLVLENVSPIVDTDAELETVIEELRIHQVELELQLEELQQSYVALERSQQRNTRLFENAPIAYFIINSHGLIVNSNAVANQMLGLDVDELKGRAFAEFVAPNFQDVYLFFWRSPQSEQGAKTCELELQLADGSRLPALLNCSMPEDDSTDSLLAVSNLSSIKQSDEALARSSELAKEVNRARLKVLSAIAPEFQRPLITILSSLELLHKHGKRLTERKRNQLYHTIRNLAWYLNDTIQDAHNIKELERNQLFPMESFDVLAFTQHVINNMEVITDGRHIVLEILTEQEQANIVWNLNLYRRILMNSLGSLLRFTNNSIRVQLSVHDTNFTLRIDVQTSSLMAEEIELLFESFYEGQNTDFIQGRGNGLLLAYHTIHLHGGSIRHKSYEGGGISFLIELPKLQVNPSPYRH